MGRTMPWDEIPDNQTVPEGVYEAEIEDIEETETRNGAKLMYHVTLRVTGHKKHAEFANMPLHEYFVIGSDDDPEAEEATTWKKLGGIRFKKFLQSCGITEGSSVNKLISAAKDRKVLVTVKIEEDDQGTMRNRCGKFYALGEAEVGGDGGDNGKGKKKPAAPAPKKRPPVVDDDDDDADDAPPPKKAAKPKPAPVEDDEEDEAPPPPKKAKPAAAAKGKGKPAAKPAVKDDDDDDAAGDDDDDADYE